MLKTTSVPADSSSHLELSHLILMVFEAVFGMTCISLPGYILARKGMFDAELQKFVASLTLVLFTPCLIFDNLASQITLDQLKDLSIIVFIFAVQTVVSYLCSIATSKLFGFKKRPRNFVVAMAIFGNSTSVPLSLVTSLSQTLQGLRWDKVPGDNAQKVTARGILYLLIFQQLGLLLRWSWGYNVLLAPPYKLEEEDDYAISTIEQGQRVYRDEPEPEQEQWQDQEQQQGQEQEQQPEQQPELEQELEPEDGLTPWGSNRTRSSFLHQFRNGSIDSIEDVAQTCRRESRTESDHGSERMIRRHREPLESEAVPTAETRSYPTAEPQVAPAAVIVMTAGGTNGSTTSGPNMPAGETDGSITSGSRTRPPTFRTDKQSATGLKRWPIRTREAVKRGVSRIFSWMRVVSNKIFRLLPDPMRTVCTKIFTGTNYFLRGLWGFMNPPLFAILIAILVALIPSLQKAFFTEGTFVKNAITSAISRSGDVAVPLILVVLGANLAKNTIAEEPKHSTGGHEAEDRKLLIASLVSRMVLPTIVMVPLLALIVKELNISVLGDPIFIVVCCLLSGAPSALQLAQICQINGVYVSVMSDLLFQSYVVWIFPSTLVLVVCALKVVEWAAN